MLAAAASFDGDVVAAAHAAAGASSPPPPNQQQLSGLHALCETCAHDDDVGPLLRLVFEAQEAAPEADRAAVAEDGRRMAAILAGCLEAVERRAAARIRAACEAHAGEIADSAGEVVAVGQGLARVRRALAASNADVQRAGAELSRDLRELRALAAVQSNLRTAGAALGAARAVLARCLEARRLVDAGELHAALALLDALSRKELAALLAALVAGDDDDEGEGGGRGGGGGGVASGALAATTTTTTAITDPWAIFAGLPPPSPPPDPSRASISSSRPGTAATAADGSAAPTTVPPLPDGPTLARAFAGLVAGLRALIQSRALAEFDAWLMSARAAAREVGMAAVRAAARGRALDDDLADERRQVLAALSLSSFSSSSTAARRFESIEELAARLADAPFRGELLRESAAAVEAEAAAAAAAATASPEDEAATAGPRGIAALREAGLVGSMRSGGGAGSSSDRRQQMQAEEPEEEEPEEEEEARSGLPPLGRSGPVIPDVASLRPGEPDAAVRLILARHRRRGELDAAAHARAAAAAVREDSGPGGALLRLDMRPLLRALHVHGALGPRALAQLRQRYSEQRRLQAAADLQPPAPGGARALLEGQHQPFLARVAGFFVIEAYVARVAEGLVVGRGASAALWAESQRALKATLEAALESAGGGGGGGAGGGDGGDGAAAASRLLLVKDFVLLVCRALERASPAYRTTPLLEVLAAGPCARYHWLLAQDLEPRLVRALLQSAAAELVVQVTTPAQHRELTAELGLPASLVAGRVGRMSVSGCGGGGGGDGGDDDGPPPSIALPYTAPYSPAAPAALRLMRRFVTDSVPYLRGLCSEWELPAAAFAARDRALAAPVSRALAERLRRCGGGGGDSSSALRDAMRCAADAWALRAALEALDDFTAAEASPAWQQRDVDGGGEQKKTRRRRCAAILGASSAGWGGGTSEGGGASSEEGALAAALRGAQDAAEAAVLRVLTARVAQTLADARRAADWAPREAVALGVSGGGAGVGSWPDALVSFLRETMDAGARLLPPDVLASLMRRTLRAAAAALTDWLAADHAAPDATAGGGAGSSLAATAASAASAAAASARQASAGGGGGLMASLFSGAAAAASVAAGGYNLYAVERMAVELAAARRGLERWEASAAAVSAGGSAAAAPLPAAAASPTPDLLCGIALELAEPEQLCALLLSGSDRLSAVVASSAGSTAAAAPSSSSSASAEAFAVALQRPLVVARALERLRECPSQAKRHPQWPTRRVAEALAKELRGGRR
jgi:hypothetical protein